MNVAARVTEAAFRTYSRVAPTERGGYRLARLVRRLRPRERWRDRFRVPAGLSLELDLGQYPDCCMAYGIYEITTLRLIRSLLKPGDHFVDAGANIGYITLHVAQHVGTAGRVDAFEPEPHNRKRLERHLAMNHLADRVHVHSCALADGTDTATIHFYPAGSGGYNHGASSLYADPACQTIRSEVTTARMDELIKTPPRVIKMDVEGAEPLVVEGMAGLLAAPEPPSIVGEYNPTQSRNAGVAPDAWIRRACKIQPRYRVFVVGTWLRPVRLEEISKLGQINLLLSVTHGG